MASWNGPDPKPARRVRASRNDLDALREMFAHHPCVSCGVGGSLELHHIHPRSQGGDDVAANLAPICRSCHMKIEGHESGWEQVAASIRQYVVVDNDRRGYQEDKAGESFNRRYPPLPSTDPGFLADYQTIMSRHSAPIPKGDAK